MYSLKKPYELPEKIQAPNCMYHIKPINNLNNVDVKSELVVNGTLDSRSDVKATLVNGGENHSQSSKKNKRRRTDSNPKSPEIAKEFGAKGKENQPEVKNKESAGGSKKSPKNNMAMETKTQADEVLREKIIAKLEARQNEVIQKLMHLRDMLNNASGATLTAGGGKVEGQLTESVEAVVHADPANPPLSLLFLARLLRDSYGPGNVNLKAYRHSSCQDQLSKSAQLLNQPALGSSAGNTIDISVIWKKVSDGEAQLLVQPTLQAPIRGEANVARYLSRLLPGGHSVNYDALNWEDLIRVDGLLEKAMDGVDLAQLEKQLEAHNPCLLGEASIADFVTFSVVSASVQANASKLQKYPQVLKWFKACQAYGGFQL